MSQEYPAAPKSEGDQPPALRQARWSGKKTAVVAALAIGLSSAGAITASAAVPSGSVGGSRNGGPGGFGNFRQLEGGVGGSTQQQPGGTNGNAGQANPGNGSQGQPGAAPGNAPDGGGPA